MVVRVLVPDIMTLKSKFPHLSVLFIVVVPGTYPAVVVDYVLVIPQVSTLTIV